MSQKSRKSDPMRTKNGRERLGPLNLEQLNKLIANARPKNKAKIQRRIHELVARKGLPVNPVTASEEAVTE
jgi:hypothetical protein